MGCCFSSDDDKSYQDPGATERTRLLGDPVSNTASRPIVDVHSSQNSLPPQKGDEQSALNRILHETASNVIDVAAIDTRGMEQHEYMDRARQYSARVSMMANSSNRVVKPSMLASGVAAPQMVLAAKPVSLADVQLITTAAEKSLDLSKKVKVEHKEDLVVPFGVP